MNRGNKLWEGNRMILPEHRAYMIEREVRAERFVERPELDDEKLMEMSRLVSAAMDSGSLVTLKLYDPMGLNTVEIRPIRLELHELRGYNEFGKLISVELSEIVDVASIE